MARAIKESDKKYIVSQDNKLIQKISTDCNTNRNLTRQSFILDIYQKRLLLLLISHISPYAKKFPVEEISFSNFMRFMNIPNGGRQYEAVKQSILNLMGMSFAIEVKSGVYEYYHWIAGGCRVDEAKKMIYIQLDPALDRFLLGNRKNFTKYELSFIMQLQRKYSCRLYEYFRSMIKLKCVNMTVENFSKKITDDKYKKATDQKRFAIVPSINEINAKTDIMVELEEIREPSVKGRIKTMSYKFHIREKNREEKEAVLNNFKASFGKGLYPSIDIFVEEEPETIVCNYYNDMDFDESKLPF